MFEQSVPRFRQGGSLRAEVPRQADFSPSNPRNRFVLRPPKRQGRRIERATDGWTVATNYFSLRLGDVMMHQVTRPDEASIERFKLSLTDEPVTLSDGNRALLTRRFVKALTNRALPIVQDNPEAVVPSAVRQIWSDSADLASTSQSLARHLVDAQPRSALPGLLVVAEAWLGDDELLLIAKVEHQDAMRIEAVTTESGHRVFSIEHLRELVFADNARVYKVSVLSRSASSTGIVSGEIVDDQNGGQLAKYFLLTFLGMKLREEPAVLTENFLNRFTTVINKSLMPSESKLDVQSALVSQIASNARTIDPVGFIRDFVPAPHQQEVTSLAAEEHVPMAVFAKDTTRIAPKLHRLRVDFQDSIVLIAPPEAVGPDKAVQFLTEGNGTTAKDVVQITGRVKGVRGNGGR